jgi:hypothetical protein
MREAWAKWMKHRRGYRKPGGGWEAMFNEQVDLLEQYDELTTFEMVMNSLRNGYQGLFPPKAIDQRPASTQPTKTVPQFTTGRAAL